MIRALCAVVGAMLLPAASAAPDQQQLYGACFAASLDAARPANDPAGRINAMSVSFQGFDGSLLASVSYRLRYGTRFGFSGDCTAEEGGFSCKACGSDGCASSGQTFKLRWSGGDTLDLVNDTTGLFAANTAGGRDRLAPGGPNAIFSLRRAANEACAP